MYAVIETGGKQYRVSEGDVISVEKLNASEGSKIEFDKVLLVGGDEMQVGTPLVEGYKVFGEVVENGKAKKVIIYKYKAKKDYRRKTGHRQPYTMVKITGLGQAKVVAKKAEKAEKAPAKEVSEVAVSMSMKKDELLAAAEAKGLKLSSKATKAEIIEAIEAAAK